MSKKFVCLAAACMTLALAGAVSADQPGKVLFEYFFDISGTSIDSDLLTAAKFPNGADQYEFLDTFKGPVDWKDNYGERARAYLTPPETGDYTFWVSGDDNCQLWLSTDDTPANAQMIAQVASWTNPEEWTKEAGQQSAPITLTAGQTYYIEALLKEGGGGDSLTVAWTGPGIGDEPTVISGEYCVAPEPTFAAFAPQPADGAVEVTSPLFQWTAGKTAVLHDVYMGTSPDLGEADYMGPSPVNMYFHIPGLTPGTTYYWRVDEVDAAGVKTPGDVWSFTTQPLEAHNPSPVDGALWQRTSTVVSWTAGQGAVSHQVYGSDDEAAVAAGDADALLATVTEPKLDASALLEPGKVYYWRVDEVDGAGTVTPGPVWSFSTVDPAGGAMAEYFDNMTLSGKPAVVKVEPDIDFNWGSGTEPGVNSPDAAIPVDGFSARWTAQLNVPVTGTYRIYEASDDGARTYLNGELICSGWADRGTTEDASGDLELVAGEPYVLVMEYYENGGGAAAYLRWSGPGIAKDIIPQGALQIPQVAISPNPGNNATDVPDNTVLSFTPGPEAVVHTLYFGTDEAAVATGDASVALPPMAETTYVPPAPLEWNTTYYWKVDEMAADGTIVPGLVWSFTTANSIVINTGQATLTYDNSEEPYISQIAFDAVGDLTRDGVTDLALRYQGRAKAANGVVYDEATDSYQVTGGGADIWGNADQFQYVYKTLTGDGAMVARVTEIGAGTNTWAKGGVMIRQSLDADSMHAFMPMTANSDGSAGNGASFQRRIETAGSSTNDDSGEVVAPPYWVKVERVGDQFSGYISPDGETWTQLGSAQTIAMQDPVLIGLAVTSHDAATLRTISFDSVSTTGDVTPDGPFLATEAIGLTSNSNDSAPLYVALEDAAGNTAVVTNPDPAAVNQRVWGLWRVPLSAFEGADLTNAAKLYVGVGDGTPGGSGVVNVADIRIIKPVVSPDPAAVDITAPGDVVKGFPDYDGAWPAAEYPDLAIDDDITTKYLNFGGKTQPPCGFCVTPSIGYTVVTGLTFTTANDAVERDPVAFELYGSRMSIDGPWTLIAKGDIDDFARPLEWPRQTKGVTPIGFANSAAYAHYKVVFTDLRNFSSANSMQIAEVELLGVPGKEPIILDVVRANGTSGNRDPIGAFDGNTQCLPTQAGGLIDGNMVYSDRTYPWNQTPPEMAGAEYVRIFNTDKGTADATYTVTLSRPATVAVAHDDRNTPAQDQVDLITAAFAAPGTFQDTGIDIFIYESESTPARPLSVFTADLEAGTYVFASEASSNTMYILCAMEKE